VCPLKKIQDLVVEPRLEKKFFDKRISLSIQNNNINMFRLFIHAGMPFFAYLLNIAFPKGQKRCLHKVLCDG
jgi:hypothetical protein